MPKKNTPPFTYPEPTALEVMILEAELERLTALTNAIRARLAPQKERARKAEARDKRIGRTRST